MPTTEEVRTEIADWSVWHSPILGGESLHQVAQRARNVIERLARADTEEVALFGHAHQLRILTACWLELPPDNAQHFALDAGSISMLGFEREARAIRLWNLQPPG